MFCLQGTRGSSTNLPFWPGGFELPPLPPASAQHEELDLSPFSLLTCPPGFDHGIDFSKQGGEVTEQQQPSVLNLAAVLSPGDDILALLRSPRPSRLRASRGRRTGTMTEEERTAWPCPSPPPSCRYRRELGRA